MRHRLKASQAAVLLVWLLACVSVSQASPRPVSAGQDSKGSVLFDETLSEYGESRIGTGYAELARNLRDAGYAVDSLTAGPITYEKISHCSVLVIAAPFTPPISVGTSEIGDVKRFVGEGGGLLLAAVGWSWVAHAKLDVASDPANTIGSEFGITVNDDVIYDPKDNDGGPARPIFHEFANHPTTYGLSRVCVDSPSSLDVGGGSAMVWGDDDSYAQVKGTYTYPRGIHPPFVAITEFGSGRVVYIGHGGVFHDRNLRVYDNLKLALNVFNWLIQSKRTTTVTLTSTTTALTSAILPTLPVIGGMGALLLLAFIGGYYLARRRRNEMTADEDTKIW